MLMGLPITSVFLGSNSQNLEGLYFPQLVLEKQWVSVPVFSIFFGKELEKFTSFQNFQLTNIHGHE